MKLLIVGLLVILAIAPFSIQKALIVKGVDAKIQMTAYMQERQNLAADNSTAAQCFDLYLPLLQDEADEWSTEYNSCLTQASSQRSSVNINFNTTRASITSAANDVIDFMQNCLTTAESLAFFNCFATLSSNEIETVYTISYNASQDALSLSEQLDHIDVSMYQCTNNTEHNYILGAAQIYDALDYCLQNGPPSAQ